MLFTIWIMFWNKRRISFLFFSIQNIKINCNIAFLSFFSIIFFWWKIYFYPFMIIYKRINLFWYLFLSESRSSFINSFPSSLVMIHILSLFESITRSSSLSIKKQSYLLLLIEFPMCQMFWDLWCCLNMVLFS